MRAGDDDNLDQKRTPLRELWTDMLAKWLRPPRTKEPEEPTPAPAPIPLEHLDEPRD